MCNVKCPSCGSMAQVKSNGAPIISCVDSKILVEGFTCGCGCQWEYEYQRNEAGKWEFVGEYVSVSGGGK